MVSFFSGFNFCQGYRGTGTGHWQTDLFPNSQNGKAYNYFIFRAFNLTVQHQPSYYFSFKGNWKIGMTVMAPHESKMFEAMIQSLDPASGTAKVKFAKVSFRKIYYR